MSYVRSTNSPSFIAESEIKGYFCCCLRTLCLHVWSLPLTNIGNSRWEEEHILFPYMNADCLMKHTSTKQCKYVVKQRLDNFDNFIFRELFGAIRVCFFENVFFLLFACFCFCLFLLCFLYFVCLFCCCLLWIVFVCLCLTSTTDWKVLVVEEDGVSGESHRPWESNW